MTVQDFAEKVIRKLKYWHMLDDLSDEKYLKIMYWASMHKKLNLSNPRSFNEKIQWLKLYDRKPEYTQMVDKYEAKRYVADRIGNQYIIPTLGVWNHFDEIDFDSLPNQFVLKCTHDSGGLVICRDKNKLNLNEAKKKIEKSLATNYYYNGREWPYKNVKPRIIAEKYMEDKETKELRDYKFFCFGGEVRCFKVDFDRFIEHHANYYDKDKNLLKFGEANYPPVYSREIEMSSNIDTMISFAEQLSKNIPFLRADFYDVDGKTYFGELTFYPASGFGNFTSEEWDNVLGKWIELPQIVCVWGGKSRAYISKETICILHDPKVHASLTDYKFYCFNGELHYLYISTGLENHKTAKIEYSGVRPHKEKINISKEIINKTRGAVGSLRCSNLHTPLRGEQ